MMTNRAMFELHGFRFDSDLLLDAERLDSAAEPTGSIPVRLVLVDPIRRPENVVRTLLRWEDTPDEGLFELVETSDGSFVLSVGDYHMRMSKDLSRVEVAPGEDRDMAWLGVLVEGWLVAVMVALSGRTALHASSVLIDGQLVAFVGEATQGKSTLAAGLCRLGAELFGDDVLAVEVVPRDSVMGGDLPQSTASSIDGSQPATRAVARAARGSSAIRLRGGAVELGLHSLGPHRPVGDRSVVSPPRVVAARESLRAVLIPWVSDTYEKASISWVSAVEATKELMHYPRVFEWVDRGLKAQEFVGVADLASCVPVGHLTIPPGDRGFREVMDLLRETLDHWQ
jgi:hypothetical protein